MNAGLVRNIADLYDLTMADMMRLPGFGERSARKVLDSLEASKTVPFDRVVYALSIPFVGIPWQRKSPGHSPPSTC